jgi:hypothetical protein
MASSRNSVCLVSFLAVLIAATGCGPIGPIAGGRLVGSPVSGPPPAGATVRSIETVQLETRPESPHSVNTWWGEQEGQLYIATSLILGDDVPTEREWVRNVVGDPRVRLRVEDKLYDLRAIRVENAGEREAALAMLLSKYDVEEDAHTRAAWVFRLEAR